MDKIIILGGDSRLAKHFMKIFPDIAIPIPRNLCNITKTKDLNNVFKSFEFKYVLNCAALTDIDNCETHPEKTFEVNFEAPGKIKELCFRFGKKPIFISSNYAVNPINIYGKSKQMLETLADKNSLVIRTDFYDEKNYIIKNLLEKNSVKCFTNAFFNPVSVNRLCKEIWINRDKSQLLNIFTKTCLSYFEFAKMAEDKLNIKGSKIGQTLLNNPLRPLKGCVKSDIKIETEKDLEEYANYIKN